MAKIGWYFNRLRAMSAGEIFWRIEQKKIEKTERQRFGKSHISITERVFWKEKEALSFHTEKLPLAVYADHSGAEAAPEQSAKKTKYNRCISLLGGYAYEKYRKDWHAGFQTANQWPLDFSYDLKYKQRDEIGDARTNWELNRHFQFALLACAYYQSGEEVFWAELEDLFTDWNQKNPFLQGISWTSVMEAAIRDINWIYTLGFLTKALDELEEKRFSLTDPDRKNQRKDKIESFCNQLRIGIINMTQYISQHYSRYSSANNHVIVEAAAMGIAGIVLSDEEWTQKAISILVHEIPRQNYPDGVNKEVSLHYQSFFMEAVGLLALTMEKTGRMIPADWKAILQKMSRYMADCQGSYGETIVFGDDDAGKILDLEGVSDKNGQPDEKNGALRDHYRYVLQLMSLILPERYAEQIDDRTLLRIVSEKEIENTMQKQLYQKKGKVCYEKGGVSILRSRDERVLIGIDHGELGFGSIAAHGHADALSFQMYLDGESVFADAGTYIYHTDLVSRNAFRKTQNHNTITINGKDQSEMLGAFLWGKRAKTTLLRNNLAVGGAGSEKGMEQDTGATAKCPDAEIENAMENTGVYYVEAEQDGYAPVIHRRKFVFDEIKKELLIMDTLSEIKKEITWQLCFLTGEAFEKVQLRTETEAVFRKEMAETWISDQYGIRKKTKKIIFSGKTDQDIVIRTRICWQR